MEEMELDLKLLEDRQEPGEPETAPAAAAQEAMPQEAVKETPAEPEASADVRNFEGWRQFVHDLETDQQGSALVTDAEPVREMPAEAEPSLGPELAAAAEQPASQAEFDKLRAERDQLLDRLARLQAEFENARKRAERERASTATMPPATWSRSFCRCWTTSSWRSSPPARPSSCAPASS